MKSEIDIAVLKTQIISVQGDINSIKTNHLPHIYQRMGEIEKKQAYFAGAIAVIVVLSQLIFKLIFK